MIERTEEEIVKVIKQIVWSRAGLDPAKIIRIQPQSNGKFNNNWHSHGMAVVVSMKDMPDIILPGMMIDDALEGGDYIPLIEEARVQAKAR
jgi:hypothetical protein